MDMLNWASLTVHNQKVVSVTTEFNLRISHYGGTGWVRLIRSHSSARFCFELSGNLNYKIICNSNLAKNFELEISLN